VTQSSRRAGRSWVHTITVAAGRDRPGVSGTGAGYRPLPRRRRRAHHNDGP
jgi:hypothetical protein